MALCVLLIGVSGMLNEQNNILVIIISVALGAVIGELLDLDGKVTKLGDWLQSKFKKSGEKTTIAEGFVSASLLFCVGAMTIVGSIESGLTGDNSTIFAKSLLDFIAAIVFASSLGLGVVLSSVFVLTYQGILTLIAYFAGNFLSNYMIAQMSFVGNLVIIALALNMLKITKLKVMNYVPAILMPILLCMIM
jgi:uncharacterized membrane protein YqgA involved in biofilm formation